MLPRWNWNSQQNASQNLATQLVWAFSVTWFGVDLMVAEWEMSKRP